MVRPDVLGWRRARCSERPTGSPGDQQSGERLRSVSQALTSEQQRILGFESVGGGSVDWASTSGVISQNAQHVEGNASLAISNSGNTTITSAALSSLGPVNDKITLDLLLPTVQPNPWWMGTVRLVIECPSQQLWWEGLAERQLTGSRTPLLTGVTNGMGARTEIDYGQLTATELPDPDEPLAAFFPPRALQVDAGDPTGAGAVVGISLWYLLPVLAF